MDIAQTFRDEFKEFLQIRWNPSKDLLVVVGLYLAVVVCFYTAFQIVTTANVAANFILYGLVGLLLLGSLTPVIYNGIIKKRAFSETGITKKYWIQSLILGFMLGLVTYFGTLATITLPSFLELLPLATMSMAVGLFEAIFFRGWIQLRLEKSFGAIPAIFIGSGFYAIYHIGYGMTLSEIGTLFLLGLTFAIAFRVTRNILVLFPFYTWIGGLYNNISEGLVLPLEATYGFAIILFFTIVLIGTIKYVQGKRLKTNGVSA